VKPGEKDTHETGWPTFDINKSNYRSQYFRPYAAWNVGLRMGETSKGLTDADLDCPEAMQLADMFLPTTEAEFGRKSKPHSHRLFYSDLWKTESKNGIKWTEYKKGQQGQCLVELRTGGGGKGAQTMAPPSLHPSGERVTWDKEGEPAAVDGADLKNRFEKLALATLLLRHWPREKGSRNDHAMTIGGLLARAGWVADDISQVVEIAAYEAGDEQYTERGKTAAHAVAMRAEGDKVSGLKRVGDVWGGVVADTLAKWLEIGAAERVRMRDGGKRQLPVIRVVSGEIARMVDESEVALREAVTAGLPVYVRGGALVEPVEEIRPASHKRQTKVAILKRLSEPILAYLINRDVAVFQRLDTRKNRWVDTDPPPKLAQTLLLKGKWSLPSIAGVIGTPTLRPDGSILSEPGYDAPTRLWCVTDVMLPTIPEKPTRRQAVGALLTLRGLLRKFPFVSLVDRAVALSAMLTVVGRGGFDTAPAPMFPIFAPDVANGKSLLVDVCAALATGRLCPVIGGTRNVEEMEKRLGALLLEGVSLVSLDNMSFDIEGDLLSQMCTQAFVKVRILGKSEMPECEWRGVSFATGNNILVKGDMTRRSLPLRLDAKSERPERRSFPFNPVERVLADRGRYVAAALTIIKAYLAAGVRVSAAPLAGYGVWERFARFPLIWLGEADPVDALERSRAEDPERRAALQLIRLWEMPNIVGLNQYVSATELVEKARGANQELEDLLRERCSGSRGAVGTIEPKRVGHWLRKLVGRIFDGKMFVRAPDTHKKSSAYALVKAESSS
jgi:hypothetical protein